MESGFGTPCGRFDFLTDRAVWWSELSAVLVSDLHLGKEATFRQHGLAVPDGSSQKCLQRLGRILSKTNATRLFILGDLFHARTSLADQNVKLFRNFLESNSDVQVTLIRGNHDIHTGRFPDDWKLDVVDPPLTIDRVMLAHYPRSADAENDLVLAGHLHPAIKISGDFGSEGKQACFWLAENGCLTLPAFGDFVGTAVIRPGKNDRVWMAVCDQIIEIPIGMTQR